MRIRILVAAIARHVMFPHESNLAGLGNKYHAAAYISSCLSLGEAGV
jgi:hypothetical protein